MIVNDYDIARSTRKFIIIKWEFFRWSLLKTGITVLLQQEN
jgi:hypothetical protein